MEDFFPLLLTLYISLASLAAFIVLDDDDDEDDLPALNRRVEELTELAQAFRRTRKRARQNETEDEPPRQRVRYDYQRAFDNANRDYLGPNPLYGHHIEGVFRVTRSIVERLIQVVGNADPFFTHRRMVGGEMGIYPEVKTLMALKQLAFGCSATAFLSEFQMGKTCGRDCLKKFAKAIANSHLRDEYLRPMNRSDAMRVSALHEQEFGVKGCIGALDCMHVFWRTCPVAWQGQFKGKEGYCSIVLEAVGDHTCWLWHTQFGHPGTLNDINIWEKSKLLKRFVDGAMEAVDFEFEVAGTTFDKLWLFVDGIYPELSRFVKTISVPITRLEKKYVKWQEAKRKSIERAFGILQRKFQIIARPLELFCKEDIKDIVDTCTILHNMMVEVRISRDQPEEDEWYMMAPDDFDEDELPFETPNAKERVQAIESQWPDASDNDRRVLIRNALRQQFNSAQTNWDFLYDRDSHYALRSCIIQQLDQNGDDDDSTNDD